MHTLLVALDHTAAAEHTLAYANKLAVRWPAEIVVLHCVPDSEISAAQPLAAHEQRLRSQVERLRYQQLTRHDGRRLRYHFRVLVGCLHDHAAAEVARCAASLVVMGLEHIDCHRPEAPGNHAAALAALVPCPVLVVPPGRRSLPQRVAFTAAFDRLPLSALPRLSALAGAFPAALELVQFYAPTERGHRLHLKQALRNAAVQLTWPTVATHLIEDDAPLEGIGEFCARTQAQLLVVAPASATELRRYFDTAYARTQAFHLRIPVLVLHPAAQPAATTTCCDNCAQRLTAEPRQLALPAGSAQPQT